MVVTVSLTAQVGRVKLLRYPKTQIGEVSAVLAQEEPEDGEAAESWNVQFPCRSGEARTCCAIFQAALIGQSSEEPARTFVSLIDNYAGHASLGWI